jgi:hypothetical protein
MTLQPATGGGASRASPGGGTLGEVLDRVLDKGIVIDAWASVSLLGIEVVTIQAQVVVASVETYLKYAQEISSVAAPEIGQPKDAGFELGAAEASRPSGEHVLSEDEVARYLGAHAGGLRLEQLVEQLHAPREQVEHAVHHLIDQHKVRKDAARELLLPA